MNKCINCGCENEVEADGIYVGYMKCAECGFLKQKKVLATLNPMVIMPDPQDAVMCESCQ